MLKKVWGDPVASKVIATLLSAAALSIFSYLFGWWPVLWSGVLETYRFLGSSTMMPHWLIGLLGLGSACLIAVLSILILVVKATPRKPPVGSYIQDEFFDLRWRWRLGGRGEIYHLTAFCLRCDYQVEPRHASGYDVVERYEYWCDDCQKLLRKIEMPVTDFENRVERQIHKKLRNGTWVDSVTQMHRHRDSRPNSISGG